MCKGALLIVKSGQQMYIEIVLGKPGPIVSKSSPMYSLHVTQSLSSFQVPLSLLWFRPSPAPSWITTPASYLVSKLPGLACSNPPTIPMQLTL